MMDLNFGEIIEPSTRAFWDDYDENEEDSYVFEPLEWNWMNEENEERYPEQLQTLVVIEGYNITDFINASILKDKLPTCQLVKGHTSVYDFPDNNLTICLSEEKDLNNFGPITEMLEKWIFKAENVVGISIQPSVTHKGTSVDECEEICFIKGVNSKFDYIKELAEPNFVSGVSAGVVSWRKFKNLDSSAYVVYLESPVFDSLSTQPILKLFQSLNIPCVEKYQLKYKNNSNLYM